MNQGATTNIYLTRLRMKSFTCNYDFTAQFYAWPRERCMTTDFRIISIRQAKPMQRHAD
jgi:hypothetical protein